MRHVGPLLVLREALDVEQIVQFPHAISGMGDANKNGRSDWDEGLNLAERDLERFNLLAPLL